MASHITRSSESGLEAASSGEGAVRRARSVLGRSDLPEMASDLHREVKAHGDVVLDHLVPVALLLPGVTEHLKERSPIAAMVIDRLGAVTTCFELSSLTRGRITHYAIPDHLKDEHGVRKPKDERWTPPPVSALLTDPEARA